MQETTCKTCGNENFPLTDVLHGVGTTITPNCGRCGAVIMERCAVCGHLQPLGTMFCRMKGIEIAPYVAEQERRRRDAIAAEAARTAEWERKKAAFLAVYNRLMNRYGPATKERFCALWSTLSVLVIAGMCVFERQAPTLPTYITLWLTGMLGGVVLSWLAAMAAHSMIETHAETVTGYNVPRAEPSEI